MFFGQEIVVSMNKSDMSTGKTMSAYRRKTRFLFQEFSELAFHVKVSIFYKICRIFSEWVNQTAEANIAEKF